MSELADFEYQLQAESSYSEPASSTSQSTASTYVDPSDGTVYEWDQKQRGWVPKVDDEFLAMYQANYGIHNTAGPDAEDTFAVPALPARALRNVQPPKADLTSDGKGKAGGVESDHADLPSDPEGGLGAVKRDHPTGPEEAGAAKKTKGKQPPTWFDIDEEKNQNVYVSGLPLDITREEFVEMMTKCGIIMEDEEGTHKVKLYRGTDGELKGDALCCYLKKESIPLAVDIIGGSTLRNHTISVERARFVQKGDYDPKKKKKKPKKKGNKQAKLLDWRERRFDGPSRKKCERIIVFKNVFDPVEFDEDPTLITDIRADLQEECGKFGTVKKILMFDRHPEGIVSVAFKEFEAADECVEKMNGRWYAKRQLDVSQWDGITNFQVEETDQERDERLKKWEAFLKEDEEQKEKAEVS